MEHGKFKKIVVMVYFLAVTVLMYYNLETVLELQVFFSYRHVFALLLVLSGCAYILVRPDLGRLAVSVQSSLIFCVPTLAALVISLLIWLINLTEIAIIFRGLSYYLLFVNLITASFAAGMLLYIFGERAIWYNLACILTVNLAMILQIISEDGAGPFFSEFGTLLRTFADETGPVIVKAELHELAFCLGAYIVYLLFRPRIRKPYYWIFAALTAFCFLAALKRIAILSIAVVVVLGIVLETADWISEKLSRLLLEILTVCVILFLILYIGMIRGDGFALLEKVGIDTMGRAKAFSAVHDFYEFSPSFLGYGVGFLTYQINVVADQGFHAVHNDFLLFFVDLGFWGYIVWLLCHTWLREAYFGRRSGTGSAILSFLLTLYLLLVSLTDNTMNYPLVHTVMTLLIAGDGFDRAVDRTHQRIEDYLDHRDSALAADHFYRD